MILQFISVSTHATANVGSECGYNDDAISKRLWRIIVLSLRVLVRSSSKFWVMESGQQRARFQPAQVEVCTKQAQVVVKHVHKHGGNKDENR